VGRGPERGQGQGMPKKTPRPRPLSGAGRGKGPGARVFRGPVRPVTNSTGKRKVISEEMLHSKLVCVGYTFRVRLEPIGYTLVI